MAAMKLSLSIDAATIGKLLAVPAVVALLESYDCKRPMVKVSDSGVSIKATIRGTRCKVKLGLGALDGALVVNIRDVRTGDMMLSVGGDWLEPWIAKYIPAWTRTQNSLAWRIPNLHFRAIGTQGDTLHVICEVT